MRKLGMALALVASAATSGCVQSRQYADVQFTPPEGNYKLLVLRPDVTVGSLTTGGMVEPRAGWTDEARANIVAALRAQQASRGGNQICRGVRGNCHSGIPREVPFSLQERL